MNLEQLLRRFRILATDTVAPFLWEDVEVVDWLNDAQAQACIRGRLIREDDLPAMCRIALVPGQQTYALHPAAFEIISLRVLGPIDRPRPVGIVTREWLDAEVRDWRDLDRAACWAIQDDTTLRIVGTTTAGEELALECYRLPIKPLTADNTQGKPEIHQAHHEHLLQWALHKAFSVPDSDGFDPARSVQAERSFTAYFGPMPDCDLRRSTRADVPNHNVLILP